VEGSSFPATGRDAGGRGQGGRGKEGRGAGTASWVEILNHFNSVTTALCKCIQSFITVTAVIATGFRGALDFNTKIPCFFSFLQRCYENHCLRQEKHPELNRALFLENGPAEVFKGNVIF
jgi:hypothetical protein